MKDKMAVDVVVVNWNSGEQLRACVESVLAFGDGLNGKIIVVDNGSTDDSLNFLKSELGILLIRANENLGFARACNRGAAEAESEYLLFLNPDARIMRGTLRAVCEYMNSEAPRMVGICGVKLVGEDGKVQRHCARFPGWRSLVAQAVGASALIPSLFPDHFMREFDHESSRTVDHVIGAFVCVRRELFEYLGGFDERFFVYLEDLDFSLRARNAGWSTYYLAEATAFHKGGGTSAQVKAHRLFYSLRSQILYTFKHFTRSQAWLVTGLTMIVGPVARLVRALLRLSPQEILDTVYGYRMLLRDLPNIMQKVRQCHAEHFSSDMGNISGGGMKYNEIENILRCPDCRLGSLYPTGDGAALSCRVCLAEFPILDGCPILLRRDNPLFQINDYLKVGRNQPAQSRLGLKRYVPSPSVNLASRRVLGNLRRKLDTRGLSMILVVGGGEQRAWLDPILFAGKFHHVIYSDIDAGADVSIVCDGHDLPFVDGSFDAVITTAVLEHVLYPEQVAAEITRVLRLNGLLYSEMPFMQQVHEGAYDFTRYTLSGHRRLFNHFTEIESGMVAGPATALVWAIENLALAFVSHGKARAITKVVVRMTCSWIKHLDRLLVARQEAMDGASCTYFFGAKSQSRIRDADITHRYVGAKHMRHV